MNWADIIVALIVVLSAVISARRGLVKSAVGIFSIIISLLIASMAYPVVADYIKDSKLESTITQTIEDSLRENESKEEKEKKSSFSFLPKIMQDSIAESQTALENAAIETTAKAISVLIINLLSIIAVFLIVRILMFILSHFLNMVVKLPIIKSVNKLLGGAAGVFVGIFIVYLLLAIIAFNTALSENDVVINEVKTSSIASHMYDNNFIVNLISGK